MAFLASFRNHQEGNYFSDPPSISWGGAGNGWDHCQQHRSWEADSRGRAAPSPLISPWSTSDVPPLLLLLRQRAKSIRPLALSALSAPHSTLIGYLPALSRGPASGFSLYHQGPIRSLERKHSGIPDRQGNTERDKRRNERQTANQELYLGHYD